MIEFNEIIDWKYLSISFQLINHKNINEIII